LNTTKLARFLGWFSLSLGLVELIVPARLTKFLGTRNRTGLVRSAYGLREVAAGVGLLTQRNKAPWIWARVGGDALDLATLGLVMRDVNARKLNVLIALASVAGITALDLLAGQRLHTD